jgi:hypothetical protein
MKSIALICSGVVLAGVLTGCVSGNSKLQAEYDRGQSELYWTKERAKQADTNNSPEPQEYLEIPVDEDPDAPIKQVPHTVVLPVLATHPN